MPDGTPSAKVLLTNLYNHTRPLIRYELTDRLTRHPAGAGHGHLRATVDGRADDTCPTRRCTSARSSTSPGIPKLARPAGSSRCDRPVSGRRGTAARIPRR